MEGFDTLRTPDVDSTFLELNFDVDLQAIETEQVRAIPQNRELFQGQTDQAQGTLAHLP